MTIELKIKSKHLALEPAIIRNEEKKIEEQIQYLKGKASSRPDADEKMNSLRWKLRSLNLHRRNNVRNEARATLLARTFLAGKPYIHSEKKRRADREDSFQRLIIPRITAMANKYGGSYPNQLKIEDKIIQEWAKF
jgi:hypothetical protein